MGSASDSEKEDKKDPSGSEEDVIEPVIDRPGKKRTSAEIVEDMGVESRICWKNVEWT